MVNELRKNIGRSMRYVDMNEQIDNQIKELEKRTFFDLNAEAQINALKQQKAVNEQLMRQPMTAQEYEEYDDNGAYIGNQAMVAQAQNLIPQVQNQASQNNDIGQMVMDGVNHLAQGMTLGWSDEAHGVMGGVKNMYENWRDNNLTGDNYIDTFKQGYQKYRDASRQELNDGYAHNPLVSGLAEVAGAVMSPIKIHSPRGYTGSLGGIVSHSSDIAKSRMINTIGTGVINGAGYTNDNTLGNYAQNIANSTLTNMGGTALGNRLFGSGNNMYKFGRGTMNGIIQTLPYAINYLENKNEK